MEQQKSFARVLTRKDVLALAFGAMIGWSWVVLAGTWIESAGSIGAMLAFLIGSIVVIFVGLTYAELTPAMPKAGGEFVFSYRAMGITPSFICGWILALGYTSVVAFEAVALPTVVEYLVPDYKHGYLWTVAGWDVYASWALIGIIGSIILTIVNYIGIKPAAFLQGVLTLLIVAVGILLMTGALFNGNSGYMEPLFVGGIKGILVVLIMTPFMFVGFDVIPQAAEEMNIPLKSIGIILLVSIFLAALWYIMVVFSVSVALTEQQMHASSLPTADAMAALFNSGWAAKLLILGGIGGIITSWNSFFVGASRVIFAMARARLLPDFLGQLHPRFKTPGNAILLVGVLSTLAPLLGRKMLVWLVDAGSLATIVAWTMVALSFLILRYREPEMERPFKVSYGKPVGFLAVIFSLGLIALYLPGSPSALVWPYEWLIFLGWCALGLIFYFWTRSSHAGTRAAMQEVLQIEE
ncbi:amino acid/polyamine/organocation transporter, APC superfamily (TC 2.A.3) [Desulfofundulus australicus DSM 11792]|uniref:Amino acid/polyamine/organocation transporter, APC superfamily (TC 2.A.3) n=1 Tax=Desulfofundulus australicus DSM 11792 TaxID=1121425 RepID=A0A1M4XGR5_9FIRM|nr:amino acid permease [Desulfofundulus australicus]SHE92685.1 amino acid/polyamine/organocation transporter, APC superfamily (TC 2.A.3) [Desulfofundulus australicus DSM 11792]